MIKNNHHIQEKKSTSELEAILYPGQLPEGNIVPEKLELAAKRLRTVKNLKAVLAKYNKISPDNNLIETVGKTV